jgi:hypothetical protein
VQSADIEERIPIRAVPGETTAVNVRLRRACTASALFFVVRRTAYPSGRCRHHSRASKTVWLAEAANVALDNQPTANKHFDVSRIALRGMPLTLSKVFNKKRSKCEIFCLRQFSPRW